MHARQVKTEADVQAWRNRTKIELSELLTRVSCEEQFDRVPFCSDHARFSSAWDWEAIAAKGYVFGAKLPRPAADKPYGSWSELAGLAASNLIATRAALQG